MPNIVELHTDKCIFNCHWCPQWARHVSSLPQEMDLHVKQTFSVLQDTINTLWTPIYLQYNMPLGSLQSLDLYIKEELIEQLWFTIQLDTSVSPQFYTQKMTDLLSYSVLGWIKHSLLIALDDPVLSLEQQIYVSKFLYDYYVWSKNNAISEATLLVTKNMFISPTDPLTIKKEWESLESKVWAIFKTSFLTENLNIHSNYYVPQAHIYDEQYPFFSEHWYQIHVQDSDSDPDHTTNILLNKRTLSKNFIPDSSTKIAIREAFIRAAINECDKWLTSNLAIYPQYVRLAHDARALFGGSEYFKVSHERFQEYLLQLQLNPANTDISKWYIDFSPLIKENLVQMLV